VYVCPKCDSLVDQPRRRWWWRWRYCPNGHALYVRGLGPSLEQSFWNSFRTGLARGIFMIGLVVLLAMGPDHQAVPVARGFGFVLAIFHFFTGLILLIRAHFWAGRAGPVQRLVPHARGRASGFLAAVPCQLAVVIALVFAK